MQQQSTGLVCGRPDTSGGVQSSFASVKAYRGDFNESRKLGYVLDSGSIEFTTSIAPFQGHANIVKWPEMLAGVTVVSAGSLCCIDAVISTIVP